MENKLGVLFLGQPSDAYMPSRQSHLRCAVPTLTWNFMGGKFYSREEFWGRSACFVCFVVLWHNTVEPEEQCRRLVRLSTSGFVHSEKGNVCWGAVGETWDSETAILNVRLCTESFCGFVCQTGRINQEKCMLTLAEDALCTNTGCYS